MDNLVISSNKVPILAGFPTATEIRVRRWQEYPALPVPARRPEKGGARTSWFVVSSVQRRSGASQKTSRTVFEKVGLLNFASVSSTNSSELSAASGTPQTPVPPAPSYFGSPLFWVGVGVGLSALFSMVAARVKQYAMQQAFKTMMSQAKTQNDQFNNATLSAGPQFSFPSAPLVIQTQSSTSNLNSQPVSVVDIPASKVEETPPFEVENESLKKPKKHVCNLMMTAYYWNVITVLSAFVDISPEEVLKRESKYSKELEVAVPSAEGIPDKEVSVSTNGAAIKQEENASHPLIGGTSGSVLSVDALEKMMDDPSVQKMVYPNNMGGGTGWDNRMMESLKNFDLGSPEVKQQFNQIGLTPEEVISKIMANPDVALAFQNPKVQAAIMDCSQNPLSIAKYQNDKEVMDVFNKISELFPGVTGNP
ncbi:Protein TIC 40, chloroplastic [Apostasia shenzhenica]|uniref:Protein TIC 40, chloroplastic n=1 Tax=Apostasia shenzhenica TaxID=1088818 RepID=A0A2I0BG43_9ASPA|nr:Protein TIC 40, chloroplastic [Apostasia shenzhenica]